MVPAPLSERHPTLMLHLDSAKQKGISREEMARSLRTIAFVISALTEDG